MFNIKKMLLLTALFVFSISLIFSQNQPKVDQPKIPSNDTSKTVTKDAQDADKMLKALNKNKKKVQLPAPKGPVVAFIPFNYSYAVGQNNGIIATNEIVVAMVKSQVFTPASIKTWFDGRFKDGEGRDIQYMIEQMRKFRVPADYVCLGYVFKSGNEFGIRVSLYPVDAKQSVSHYFRYFSNFSDMPNIATQIIEEMKKRATGQKIVTAKKILINNFDLNYLIYTKSETGDVNISPLPFIKLEGMEYKKEDFFNELLLYNFSISRLYTVYNNNIVDYTQNTKYKPSVAYDYIINSVLKVSKDLKTCTIEVTDGTGNNTLFSKTYRFEKLQLSDLYQEMRKWVKDISLTLLTQDELKKAGEINISSLYSDESVYLDEYYLGNGDQKNMLVPVSAEKVKYWLGETAFTDKFLTPQSFVTNYINVSPYSSGVSKPPKKFFNMSVGANIIGGFYFHPQFNTQQKVIFHNNYLNEYNYFNMGDILNSPVIESKFYDYPSFLVGLGFDFSLESKYLMLTNQLNLKFGYFSNKIEVKPDKNININSTPISYLSMKYELSKFNVAFDYSFLPAAMFFNSDSPVRMYGGLGLFAGIWYSYYNENIKGTATLTTSGSPYNYVLDTAYENRQSVLMVLGIFPEVGTIIKISRFNIKIGVSYYFDLYKTSIWNNSEFGSFDKFDTGSFIAKVGFGYYL
jgi:hypothetical protein